jgi:hypothetical protein
LFRTFILKPLSVKIVSFDTFCLDISFFLKPFSFSHLFLLTFSYLANKIHHVYYKTWTKSLPQNLPKVFPSITSYFKACTKYFPVLLRTTKLQQISKNQMGCQTRGFSYKWFLVLGGKKIRKNKKK